MAVRPHCLRHPAVELSCPACLGQKGGRSRSAKKQKAARKNGSKNKEKRNA